MKSLIILLVLCSCVKQYDDLSNKIIEKFKIPNQSEEILKLCIEKYFTQPCDYYCQYNINLCIKKENQTSQEI